MAFDDPLVALGGIEGLHDVDTFFQEACVADKGGVEKQQGGGCLYCCGVDEDVFDFEMGEIYDFCRFEKLYGDCVGIIFD